MSRLGAVLLACVALISLAAPLLRLHDPAAVNRDHVLAPPMRVYVRDADGRWRAPHVRRLVVHDRLSRTYVEDPGVIRTLTGGAAVASAADLPWFPLGTDTLGRDIWSRLVMGARLSLGIAVLATLGALLLGVAAGGAAGFLGGFTDTLLMRACELVLILPALYVVLALRAALPLVMPTALLFGAMTLVLAIAGTPQVARAVRAVTAAERDRDYVVAARATGRRPAGVFLKHVLPASREVVTAQALLLFPAFVLAEATLSFMGLGFDAATPSWGTALQEAANIRAIAEYPWVLAPAAAIALTVLSLTLLADGRDVPPA
jgi:peptide/nickel transport system permease protein